MSATPSLVLSQGNRAARSPKFRIRRQRGELRRPNRGSRCAPRRQERGDGDPDIRRGRNSEAICL